MLHRAGLLVVVALSVPAAPVGAACTDPSDIPIARAAIDAACPCALATTARGHRQCARDAIAGQVEAGALDPSCVKDVRRCVRRSTCGRPGMVTCCRLKRGEAQCRVTSPERCIARGGCAGLAPSCCDACGSASCVGTTTTTLPPAVCGNGVIESGEQCDGQPFCLPGCRLDVYACCDVDVAGDVCSRDFRPEPGPPFCLEAGAVTHLGATAPAGSACSVPGSTFGWVEGSCSAPTTFAPTTFCCNVAPCHQTTVADTEALVTWLLLQCEQPFGVHPAIVGTCGSDFQCHPG